MYGDDIKIKGSLLSKGLPLLSGGVCRLLDPKAVKKILYNKIKIKILQILI